MKQRHAEPRANPTADVEVVADAVPMPGMLRGRAASLSVVPTTRSSMAFVKDRWAGSRGAAGSQDR